jgi:hypothetical protein
MAVMRWREDYHLFLIGTVAFSAALTGFVARRRHWPGDAAHIIGMGSSYIALLTAFYVDNGKQLPALGPAAHRRVLAAARPDRHPTHLPRRTACWRPVRSGTTARSARTHSPVSCARAGQSCP